MGRDDRPAPVVTIRDPGHPARLHDVLETPRRAPLRRTERLLVATLVLLLLAGTGSARSLRADAARRDLLSHASLTATVTASQPAQPGPALQRLDLAVQGDDRTDLELSSIHADHGWDPPDEGQVDLARGSGALLTLVRPIDCSAPALAPSRLTVRVRVSGSDARTREVTIARDPGVEVPNDDAFCGRVDVAHAVIALSSALTRVGTRSTVVLSLGNVSLRPVQLAGVRLVGFAFDSSTRLPWTLEARRAGVLDLRTLVTYPIVFDARIADCEDARATLKAAAESDTPNVLPLRLLGDGADTLDALRIAGLEEYLEAEWRSQCG